MNILINGAGLAGVTMGLALEHYYPTATFSIIERSPELRTHGSGIALPGNALDGLAYLGLRDSILSIAHRINKIRYLEYSGALLSEANLSEDPTLADHEFCTLQRDELMAVLAGHLKCPIKLGTTISSHTLHKDHISVTLSDDKVIHADLVVDASGVNSQYRQEICHQDLREDLGVTCWRFLTTHTLSDPHFYLLNPAGSLGLIMPTTQNRSYVYLHRKQHNQDFSTTVNKQALLNHFASFPKAILTALHDAEEKTIIPGRLTSIQPPILTDHKRTAFIGDAGAACSPQLQQGYAGAIEDVLTLTWSLINKGTINNALTTYEHLRLPRVQWIKEHSDVPLRKMSQLDAITPSELKRLAERITQHGPLNVQGWRTLLKENYLGNIAKKFGITEAP